MVSFEDEQLKPLGQGSHTELPTRLKKPFAQALSKAEKGGVDGHANPAGQMSHVDEFALLKVPSGHRIGDCVGIGHL
jgi:hypothetical protein